MENGRRYFHYKMDAPILNLWAFQSARYAVERDKWHDVDIEIDYHPAHAYNVDRMIDAVKKSLDYYTANFGPYQYHQLRIVEFPRYATFAQSLPNTIPFSEAIGFIARRREARTTSTIRSTSRRTRSRTSGGRTRSSAPTRRARRCSPRRWRSTRR